MLGERQIAIEVIGQRVVPIEPEWLGVDPKDLEERYDIASEFLLRTNGITTPEEIVGASRVTSIRIGGCLVDNKLENRAHTITIAGLPDSASKLRGLLNSRVPRSFPLVPEEVSITGEFSSHEVFRVSTDFNLNNFRSADAVFKYLQNNGSSS